MPQKTTKKIVVKEVAKKATAKKENAKVTTKKVTKKVVKKATAKTVSEKQCACMKACAPTEAFWVNNGPVVKSLEDLVKALKEMSDEQYAYHTKRDGNDFARWVQDCLRDTVSATGLKKAQTRVGAVRILTKTCACL